METIPKIIHYCWFGGGQLPKEAIRCIRSWKKYMPDYEIKEWNETNVDLSVCTYVKEAYRQKKWAFVSDFFRFDILNRYGGIYLDTDVMLHQSLEPILHSGPYMGREPLRHGGMINTGLGFASYANNQLLENMLAQYHTEHFLDEKNQENLTTVVQRLTAISKKYGYDETLDYCEIQEICGIKIYPDEFFCPMGWDGVKNYTVNTYSTHLYNASWLPKRERWIINLTMRKERAGLIEKSVVKVILRMLNKKE